MPHAATSVKPHPLGAAARRNLLAEVLKAQDEENLSNRAMAEVLRCSPSVWSQVAQGTYPGNTDKYLARAADWLKHRSRRSLSGDCPFVETGIARRVLEVCRVAREMPTIGRVVLPSGCGKTRALAEVARREPDRTLHVQVGQAFHTLRGVLEELARRLALKGATSRTTPDLYHLVRDHLAGYYAGGRADPMLILLDETTTLRANALDMMRNLHDDPTSRIGLVLADTALLDERLSAREAYRHGAEQTLGRCAAVYRLAPDGRIAPADVRLVVRSVLGMLGHEGDIDRGAWSYLADVAQKPGRFHNLRKLLVRCREIGEAGGAEPTYSARELDFVAPLVDLPREFDHPETPFGMKDGRLEATAKTA